MAVSEDAQYGIIAIIGGIVMIYLDYSSSADYCMALQLTDFCLIGVMSFGILGILSGIVLLGKEYALETEAAG